MKKLLLPLILLCSSLTISYGQRSGDWCGTTKMMEQQMAQNPNLVYQREVIREKIRQYIDAHPHSDKNGASYVIPVVVHVINPEGSSSNIVSDAEIKAGIQQLSDDFRRLNPDTTDTRTVFKPYAVDCDMEFRLATIDPNGNCTKGITYSESDLTYNADDQVKAVSYWPSNQYLNIWAVSSIGDPQNGILGYAYFPGTVSWTNYGVLVRADEINTRTLSHEVGHCFELEHTFNSGCGSSCSTSGDYVCDTPPSIQATYGCNGSQNTCSNDNSGTDSPYSTNVKDQIENYMSYDACQNMFTEGQRDRMHAAIASFSQLINLTSEANNAATGTHDTTTVGICADFSVVNNVSLVCAGTTVSFKDESFNGTSTTWDWDFGDGIGTASIKNPSYIYPTPGTYTVSLTVGDGTGNSLVVKQDLIVVGATSGGLVAPVYENFEDGNFPALSDSSKEWTVKDGSATDWERTTSASYTGVASMGLKLSSIANDRVYEMVSPPTDFSGSDVCLELTFKYAYAQRTSSSEDKLEVLVSADCGKSWALKYAGAGSSLATNSGPQISGTFIPEESEWVEKKVSMTNFVGQSNILIKFKVTTGSGNYLYIDDINIGCNDKVGIEEGQFGAPEVYPNPFNESFVIKNLEDVQGMVGVSVYNLLGEEVYYGNVASQNGAAAMKIDGLTKGLYVLKMQVGNRVYTQKIIKE